MDSLARYKFMMFGYWAGIWVHLNRLCSEKKPSPFKGLVELARSTNTAGRSTSQRGRGAGALFSPVGPRTAP